MHFQTLGLPPANPGRNGTFFGAPDDNTRIREMDTLIIYGRAEALSKPGKGNRGAKRNREHRQLFKEQIKVQEHKKQEDPYDWPCVKITHTRQPLHK